MRLHRFFTSSPIHEGEINTFPDPQIAHQLRRVFRLHQGDNAVFFDGSGFDYVSELTSLTDNTFSFRVLEKIVIKRRAKRDVFIALSLIKKDNFELVVQKCVELGAAGFIPLLSDRSEKKGFNRSRIEKIVIEACEQSGRGDIPDISELVTFDEFIQGETRKIIAFNTTGETFSTENVSDADPVVACIGPEGGWTDEEIDTLRKKGAIVARLDAPVLRAETAAIAAATLFLLL
ncbi:MAG: 16S rRNA (uracil(1498)-N(3))-methyltransferase [Patescibacteria group bacterium]|nr:16S rRNA (uracil(1498)-N(3))-methyltransferase [Patescibacteria group bacterium]